MHVNKDCLEQQIIMLNYFIIYSCQIKMEENQSHYSYIYQKHFDQKKGIKN